MTEKDRYKDLMKLARSLDDMPTQDYVVVSAEGLKRLQQLDDALTNAKVPTTDRVVLLPDGTTVKVTL